jgi:hypothetical protein
MNKQNFSSSKLNINELAYDFAILIFPFLLEKLYNPLMKSAPFGLPFAWIFIMSTVYFLPLLIGRMYNQDFKNSPVLIRKFVPHVLFASMFFAYANLLYLIIPALKTTPEGYGKFILVSATVFLIMGPMAGLMFYKKNAPKIEGASTQLVIFLITIGFLPLFFIIIEGERLFGDTGVLFGIFIVLLLITGDAVFIVLIYGLYKKIKNFLIRVNIYDTCVMLLKIATPFCVSFMLVFFNINSNRLLSGIGGQSTGSIILILSLYVISGVLPLRILLMLTPPVRPLNILIGTASLVYMFVILIVKR